MGETWEEDLGQLDFLVFHLLKRRSIVTRENSLLNLYFSLSLLVRVALVWVHFCSFGIVE